MHFTPAISARAILDQDLKVSEMDMPYHEREGESKLKVWKDGVRFLKVICEAAFLYRPSRPLELLGIICFIDSRLPDDIPHPLLPENPDRGRVDDLSFRGKQSPGDQRLLVVLRRLSESQNRGHGVVQQKCSAWRAGLLGNFINSSLFWYFPLSLFLLGGLLVMPSFKELILTGATNEHWSRFIAMSFMYAVAIILIGTKLIDYSLTLLADRLDFLRELKFNVK